MTTITQSNPDASQETTSSSNPSEPAKYWRVGKETEPVWLCEVTHEPVAYAACLACAHQRLRPECPYPPHLLAALHAATLPDDVVEGIRHTGYPVVRVSSLLGCKHQSWLGRTQGYPLETPGDHWARLRGSLIHRAIEEMGGSAEGLSEKRLTTFVWDKEIAAFVTGRVDAYSVASRTLYDFKTVNTGKSGMGTLPLPKPRHVKQLHIYSWLLARNGYPPPTSIRIAYMSMGELRTVDAPALDEPALEQVEGWVLRILRDILAPTPPPPRPVEAWECRFCTFSQCPAHRAHGAKPAGEEA